MRRAVSVMTFNILAETWRNMSGDEGRGYYPGVPLALLRDRMPRVIGAIQHADADVVCLQEVGVTEVKSIWDSPLPRDYHFIGPVHNAVTSSSEPEGVMILLRRGKMSASYESFACQLDGETAACLARCSVGGAALYVACCHLDSGRQIEQGQQMSAILAQHRRKFMAPIVWCGDFNIGPHSPAWQSLKADFDDPYGVRQTVTHVRPNVPATKIDHILMKGCAARARTLPSFVRLEDLLKMYGSDHAPLIADVSMGRRASSTQRTKRRRARRRHAASNGRSRVRAGSSATLAAS